MTHDHTRHSSRRCRLCLHAVTNKDADLLPYTQSDLLTVRLALATSASTPLTVLRILADDRSPSVRRALRRNSSVRREHHILHALDAHE